MIYFVIKYYVLLLMYSYISFVCSTFQSCSFVNADKYGFGSNMIKLIHFLNYAEREKMEVIFNWEKSPYSCCIPSNTTVCYNNGFNDILNLHSILPNFISITSTMQINYNCSSISYKNYIMSMRTMQATGKKCPQIALMANKIWKLGVEISSFISNRLIEIKSLKKPLIAVHIRGGDKLTREAKPYDVSQAIQLLSQDKEVLNGTCVVVGDDWNIAMKAIPILVSRLNCTIKNLIPINYSHNQEVFDTFEPNQRCTFLKALLLDIEIITHADAAIVLARSNLAKLAGLLRIGRYNELGKFLSWQFNDPREKNIEARVCSIT